MTDKYCKDCKWKKNVPNRVIPFVSDFVCAHRDHGNDPVNGRQIFKDCYSERISGNCGKEASRFAEKELEVAPPLEVLGKWFVLASVATLLFGVGVALIKHWPA